MRSSLDDDRTAQARIRDAALRRFPVDGFGGTTIRAVAEDADVSPGLVLHHFDSKEGLRRACDRHVVDTIRTVKGEAIAEGTMTDPGFLSSSFDIAPPLVRYLGWALATNSEAAAELFDEMVEESMRLFALAEERGITNPTDDPRARSAVFLTMQLGSLVLHDHLARALGADPLEKEGLMLFSRVALEIYSGALFTTDAATEMRQGLAEATHAMSKGHSA